MSAVLARLGAAATIAALTACSGGASHAPAPLSATTTGNGSSGSASSATRTVLGAPTRLFATLKNTGAATAVNTIVVHVVPNLRDGTGLRTYAQAVSTPGSPSYRQFLTPQQIGDRFGATSSDYAKIATYFASYGLKVGGWPQRLALTVAGPRPAMEKALGTTFSFYRTTTGTTIVAPVGNIQFAQALPVDSIPDAIEVPNARAALNAGAASGSAPAVLGYTPQQIANAFDFTSAYAAGFTGAGIKIAIIGTGPAMAVDLAAYRAQYGFGGSGALSFPSVSAAAAANASGSPTATPPAVTGPCGTSSAPNTPPSQSPTATCNPEDFEAQIDTESAALAPDAAILFYLAYVPVECGAAGVTSCSPDPSTGLGYDYQGLPEADDEIQQIIADDAADVVSGSYGGPEIYEYLTGYSGIVTGANGALDPNALEPSEMAAMTAEGMAVFFSTDDTGTQVCAELGGAGDACVAYPATDPNVTAVGGVTLPLTNAGALAGPITGWGLQTGSGGASTGGVSCIATAPPWEVEPPYITTAFPSASLPTSACNVVGVYGTRVVPDVALLGDPTTGMRVTANVAFGSATQSVLGGTSVAAPEAAAMWALVLEACKLKPTCATASGPNPYRLGNAASAFWKAYQTQSTYQSTLYDVGFGNNGDQVCDIAPSLYPICSSSPTPPPVSGYNAQAGWDAVTGLGVPFARHLIQTVVGS